eukprot:PhF_6_TR8272/c1_g2_i4/m.12634/K00471/E1.14.11.1; gamma-butyrobetaine dioxygenase
MGSSLLNASLMSSRVLQLTWSCGAVSTLHSHWLRDNDPSHRHATGQRTTYLKNFSSLGNLSHAQLTPASTSSGSPGELHLKWDDGHVASYQEEFLRRHARYRDDTVNPPKVLTVDTPVPCHGFNSFYNDDKALHAFLDASSSTVLPCSVDAQRMTKPFSTYAAELMLRNTPCTAHHGRSVVEKGPKNNIAYTGEYLDLHMDLAYFESPPGFQLLHCQRFDADVKGGDSFFMDVFHAAKVLRERNPDAFNTLCRIPASFMKDDMDRPIPAQYFFHAPHIHVCPYTNHITKVYWSPPFEAPLHVSNPVDVEAMYHARQAFWSVIEDLRKTHEFRFKMVPGDCVVFNQVRVLHGRDAF